MIRNDNQLFYWLTVALALSAFLVLQAGLFSNFPIGNVTANLVLLFVIVVALIASLKHILVISLFSGFLLDLLSAAPDGVFVVSTLFTALLVYFIANNFLSSTNNNIALVIVIVVGTIFSELLVILFLSLYAWFVNPISIDPARVLLVHLPLSLLWNLILAYPVFFVYHLISNKFSKIEQ